MQTLNVGRFPLFLKRFGINTNQRHVNVIGGVILDSLLHFYKSAETVFQCTEK